MKRLVVLAVIVLVASISGAAELALAPTQDVVAAQQLLQPQIVVPGDPFPYCPWSPPCYMDKQCDSYCGGFGWGECSNNCCFCILN